VPPEATVARKIFYGNLATDSKDVVMKKFPPKPSEHYFLGDPKSAPRGVVIALGLSAVSALVAAFFFWLS
jgi:hypothetical protein